MGNLAGRSGSGRVIEMDPLMHLCAEDVDFMKIIVHIDFLSNTTPI